MRFNFTNTNGVSGSVPGQPQPPPAPRPIKPTWDSHPVTEGAEAWRYARRCELTQLAIPFVMGQLRDEGPAPASGETWREEPEEGKDERIVARAVKIARLLQDAVDRERPRA